MRWLLLIAACVVLAVVGATGCSRAPAGPAADPTKDPKHPCTWFTSEELSKRLGTPMGEGKAAGPLGTGSQWTGIDENTVYVQISVVRDVSFWAVPEGPNVELLAGVGKAAYLQPSADGWKAAGKLDAAFVHVFVGGKPATRVVAERLLVDTLSRVR